ncbi:MAG: NAD(P)H-hydrate dehydratase [Roseateles depolymerans]|uniref:Bifunctional NAD(P)H-hydrate repair enzyme n=1 Tax=Roseateles depolymerans TaxID=76731 RepID=A0A2W5E5T0_9BURK|nr:MAG: NAD(P)H-hydrate dehydratase [Roseateles depolymerans]
MRALLPNSSALPLHDVAASRRLEARALQRHPDLMERAGLAVAKLALALRQGTGPVWVVCGPGNNGGDGLVAARHLASLGVPLAISRPGEPLSEPQQPSLVIDALLGLGLNRAPDAPLQAAIDAMQATAAPRLAVDLPSGLLADSGQPAGALALRCEHTLTLLTLKPGLFTGEGRAHAGRLWFDSLGIAPDEAATAELLGPPAPLARSATAHKGSQGQVVICGGAPGMQGAARLAARAALGCGAGRVYLDLLGSPPEEVADPGWPELMRGHAEGLTDAVVVAGCGGGAHMAARLPALLATAQALVLDADALNAIAASQALRRHLRSRPRGRTLLTPHPLEAARLLGCSIAAIQAQRLNAARQLADELGCSVILKGSGSIVASPDRPLAINPTGGPALATAGSGDVLAGWLAGHWAQQPARPAHDIACAGVYQHGLAGEGLLVQRASELVERLTAA